MLQVKECKLTDLLSLPMRKWAEETDTLWDGIIILPSRRLHESGWKRMALIGCVGAVPELILATGCDDICWDIQGEGLHTDCLPSIHAIHMWSRKLTFQVGMALSTVDVVVRPKITL